jgi:hypothetical protein
MQKFAVLLTLSGCMFVLPFHAHADITFSSVSHNFGQVSVGTPAATYGVGVQNTGTQAGAFALDFTPSHGFTEQTNCPASLVAGARCEILFSFTPGVAGAVAVTWSVTSAGSTFSPADGGTLLGSGTNSTGLSLTTPGYNFGEILENETSPTYGTELSNSTGSAVTLSLGSVSSPFSSVTNCGATLPAGASCELEFSFFSESGGADPLTVQQVYTLSAVGVTIISGGKPLPNGGITMTGTAQCGAAIVGGAKPDVPCF